MRAADNRSATALGANHRTMCSAYSSGPSATGPSATNLGRTPSRSTAFLAVNEITTNAVRYAGGRGQLTLCRHRNDLWGQILDHGRGIPQQHLNESRRPDPATIGGHGLWLARHICASVEIESSRSGTRVLLRYPLPPADTSSWRTVYAVHKPAEEYQWTR